MLDCNPVGSAYMIGCRLCGCRGGAECPAVDLFRMMLWYAPRIRNVACERMLEHVRRVRAHEGCQPTKQEGMERFSRAFKALATR